MSTFLLLISLLFGQPVATVENDARGQLDPNGVPAESTTPPDEGDGRGQLDPNG